MFNPLFPVIHESTFQPSEDNSLLVLAMCSIGSIYTLSENERARGTRLFTSTKEIIVASVGNMDNILLFLTKQFYSLMILLLSTHQKELVLSR